MINTTSSFCDCPSKREFVPQILPVLPYCECPKREPVLLRPIEMSFLCECPTEPPITLREQKRMVRTTTRNCIEDYIQQIATVKFCSPKGPKCE